MGRKSNAQRMAEEVAAFSELCDIRDRIKRDRHARRVAKGTAAKPCCTCSAYPFPHRRKSGLCRWPDAPLETYPHKASTHRPSLVRCSGSRIRKRILGRYSMHPIKDRPRINRWLPKLYIATCRRIGYPDGFFINDQPIPAIRITASTKPTGYHSDLFHAQKHHTSWRESLAHHSPARRRAQRKRSKETTHAR